MTEHDDSSDAMDRLIRTTPAMDMAVAATLLLEVKQVFDELGVVFFLRQGTCLGAVREKAFIPWDDDIDIGSVAGMHGFDEGDIEPVADAFAARGFQVKRAEFDGEMWVGLLKDGVRVDWLCLRVRRGHVLHFPGVRFPVRLFEDLKEIEFLGETFLTANPPEEYLTIKYGPEWQTPKQLDYGGDVIANMPDGPAPGHPGRLRQRLMALIPGSSARLRVLDASGTPVSGAKITIAGWGAYRTNGSGYARFYLPHGDGEVYALVVDGGGRKEVLYEEEMAPGKTYVYRPDATVSSGRIFTLTTE
jgi:hypothetical protein